jgi:hypothetical protein
MVQVDASLINDQLVLLAKYMVRTGIPIDRDLELLQVDSLQYYRSYTHTTRMEDTFAIINFGRY